LALETVAPAFVHYPFVKISGSSPCERGRLYGSRTRDRIGNTLRAYAQLFVAYADLDWATVTQYARRYEPIIRAHDNELIEEMRGIAEGAGVAFEDVLAINVRTEVMYGLGELRPAADCTAFAALPEATGDGHTLLGQNWDWNPAAFDCCVILSMEQPDRPDFVTIVEAGLLAKMGMNSEGVGVATNAMVSDADKGEPGIPYHVILRSILNSRSFDQAVDQVTSVDRASSANYLIAARDGQAVDLETAPGGQDHVFSVQPREGIIGHANCFVAPNVTVRDQTPLRRPLSLTRQRTIDKALDDHKGEITVELMQSLLADHEHHPNSLCRHPLEQFASIDRSATVASVIMDLDAGEFWAADGQPCSHPYRRYGASELWG
jgi:isopenicillin-N N-acyltransferase like protein